MTKLDKVQKQIISIVDEKPGANQKQIRNQLDEIPKSTVHSKIKDLKDEGVLEDNNFQPNKSSYELKEGVDVDIEYRYEALRDIRVYIKMVEASAFMVFMLTLDSFLSALTALTVFAISFIPSAVYTVYYLLREIDFYEVKVDT